jgi:hypothetical protein
MNAKKQLRRERALKRLEVQLESGVKPLTLEVNSKYEWDIRNQIKTVGHDPKIKFVRVDTNKISIKVALSENDIDRIKKEIKILKS